MFTKIKDLRAITGAGLMECKDALAASGGDLDKAIAHLRAKGIASLNKRASNKTGEGNFGVYDGDDRMCIIELLSETDFVANSEGFLETANRLAEHIAHHDDIDGKDLQSIAPQEILDSLSVFKENIKLGRSACFHKKNGPIYHYLHLAGQNKVASMVQMSGEFDGGRSVAVHVACNVPHACAIDPADVPQSAIDEEMKFSDLAAKENAAELIRKQLSILDAPLLKDPSMTVRQYLGDIRIEGFARLKIGD